MRRTGDLAGIFGRLALGVVEIRRYRDDRFGHRFAQKRFGDFLHLGEHDGRNFRRGDFAPLYFHPGVSVGRRDDLVRREIDLLFDVGRVVLAAHQALDREDRILRVGERLPLGHLTDEAFAVGRETHHRRRGAGAFRVGDDFDVR